MVCGIGERCERGSAVLAFEWPFPGVQSVVQFQSALFVVALLAFIAFESLFQFLMRILYVQQQSRLPCIGLGAVFEHALEDIFAVR